MEMLRKFRKSEKGQAMVEFALLLPVLLLLLCAIIDFGWLYFNQLLLNNAAREGARYAAIHYSTADELWRQEAEQIMLDCTVSGETPTVQVVSVTPDVTATAQADVPVLTGFTSIFLGPSKTLTATCTMKIEF